MRMWGYWYFSQQSWFHKMDEAHLSEGWGQHLNCPSYFLYSLLESMSSKSQGYWDPVSPLCPTLQWVPIAYVKKACKLSPWATKPTDWLYVLIPMHPFPPSPLSSHTGSPYFPQTQACSHLRASLFLPSHMLLSPNSCMTSSILILTSSKVSHKPTILKEASLPL